MNLSPGQGRLVFAAIVLVFAGLGAFLLVPRSPAAPHAGASHRPGAPLTAPTTGAGPGATAPATGVPPTASPVAATPAPAGPSSAATPAVNIFKLLPFSQAALDQAVAVTTRFAVAYGTFSYRLDAAGYLATMRGLVTPQFAATLGRGYATVGVERQRAAQKQVTTATATVTGLRAFGPSSLTFVVTLVQTTSTVAGTSRLSTGYAVTLVTAGGRWEASDIELASAGNS